MAFRLDKKRIAKCFRRSLLTYDDAAIVQKKLAKRLLQLLACLPETAFQRVLEIGCCTGGLSELLCEKKPVQVLYLNDLVPDFEAVALSRLRKHTAIQIISCFGDIESVQVPSDLSLILSGATFQWLDNLPSFLELLGRKLEPGAFLAFSMFGAGTLKEFSGLTSVELRYYSDGTILSLLEKDFIVESYEKYEDQLFFPSVREILSHIRATGVGGVSEYQWNKETLKRFEKRYSNEYKCEKGLPVNYSSSCYVVRRR